jgi:hypothetical protein
MVCKEFNSVLDPAHAGRQVAVGDGERSYLVGTLRIESEHLTFRAAEEPPASAGDPAIFANAEHGWAEGLHPLDRFVKNTYELLSPLNELTAQLPMTRHELLSADKKVQRSVFGEDADRGVDRHTVEQGRGGEASGVILAVTS